MNFQIKKIVNHLKKTKHVSAIYLFGSQATSKTTPQSDIDIAILFNSKNIPSTLEMHQLKNELEEFVKRPIDLVLLNNSNPILAHQILKKGQRLLIKDQKTLSAFIARHITDYDDLKKIRAPIEHRWLAGAVHG